MTIPIPKTKLAPVIGISRSALYYEEKQPEKDAALACEIKLELERHKTYGHRRLAQALGRGKNSVRRVMRLFRLEPARRKPKRLRKKADENARASNIPNLAETAAIDRPDKVWTEDFTFLRFRGYFVYLATVIDVFTREVVGWALSERHTAAFVMISLRSALAAGRRPDIIHSDQGSEYRSQERLTLLTENSIQPSMSRKASPWENPYQEGFFSQFKLDLGDVSRFESLGELVETVSQRIRDYNTSRIHSALGMPPAKFRERLAGNLISGKPKLISQSKPKTTIVSQPFPETQRSKQKVLDFVSQEMGT